MKNRHIRRNSPSQIIAKIVLYIICILVAIMCLFPIVSLLITVTRSGNEIIGGFSFVPGTSFFKNIENLIEFLRKGEYSIARSFLNSCFISILSTSVSIYFSAMVAYACHVYDFKGKAIFEKFILFLIIIPGQLGAVGFFTLVLKMHWQDTFIPFIFPAICSPGTVFFLRQYLKQNFSKEYVDAARMDGANEFYIFNIICLPYIKPALATMALFGIISSWNSFMGPMTFISDHGLMTLPQIMYFISTAPNAAKYTGGQYMAILITMLPMLFVYFFLSKTIMKGVSNGGLK